NGAYGAEAMHVNIVNNYYKPGPATHERIRNRIISVNAKTADRPFPTIKGVWGKYYIEGNVMSQDGDISADNWSAVRIEGAQFRKSTRLNSSHVKRSYAVCCV